MLDTNIFNAVRDGACPDGVLSGSEVFITHIQKDEIENTKNADRKNSLLRTLREIPGQSISTKTSIWNDTPWDQGEWSAADGLYENILARVRTLDAKKAKRKKPLNQCRDARIAEAAIANQLILITNDSDLASATLEYGGKALSLKEFQNRHVRN